MYYFLKKMVDILVIVVLLLFVFIFYFKMLFILTKIKCSVLIQYFKERSAQNVLFFLMNKKG